MTIKRAMNEDICGTFLYQCMEANYSDIVKVLGEPIKYWDDGDRETKMDVTWIGTVNGKVFTIYDYKTGVNYMGKDGIPAERNHDWHIGGRNLEPKDVAYICETFDRRVEPEYEKWRDELNDL